MGAIMYFGAKKTVFSRRHSIDEKIGGALSGKG
jgi:hypothetical protein